jgi:hypothetical protein
VRKQKIYYMTLGSEDFKVTFYDSFLLLPESLKRLAKSFGCETQKGIFRPYLILTITILFSPSPSFLNYELYLRYRKTQYILFPFIGTWFGE